ncbi:hypothetical protein PG997_000136 [Apiospora hydei]|uniref:Uncharacterized protein n=1 Tax=Apiospora hydei TaxID=1337664 RepID=A0ABR1X9X5_9PEZI
MDATLAIASLVRENALKGAEISSAIFKLLSSTPPHAAPREVYDVAKAVSELSGNVGRITRVWPAPKFHSLYTTKETLGRQATITLERISLLYDEIQALIDSGNAAARLLWAFRRTRWRLLLLQADAYSTGVRIITNTMVLAEQLRNAHGYVSSNLPKCH